MEDIILKTTLTGGIISALLGFIMLLLPYDIPKKLAATTAISFFIGVLISVFGTLILIWIK